MTDLPAECRKHSDELPLPYEVKVTLLDAAARIEQLEREKAVVSDALQQQSDLNLKYTLEYNEMVAERNEFAARIEQLEAALRYYACKCKNPHTGCAVEFERSGNARCGWEARAALGEKA